MTFIICLFLFSIVYFSLNAWRSCTKDQALLISEGVIYFLSLQTSNFLFKCKQQSLPLLLIIYLSIYFLSLFSCDVRDSAMASITERAQRMEKDLRETNAKHDRAAAELQVRRENVHTRWYPLVWVLRMCGARYKFGDTQAECAESIEKNERVNIN